MSSVLCKLGYVFYKVFGVCPVKINIIYIVELKKKDENKCVLYNGANNITLRFENDKQKYSK